MDVGAKEELHNIIAELAADGCVIFISSELPEVLRYSHRTIVFRDGSISGDLNSQEATAKQVAEFFGIGYGREFSQHSAIVRQQNKLAK